MIYTMQYGSHRRLRYFRINPAFILYMLVLCSVLLVKYLVNIIVYNLLLYLNFGKKVYMFFSCITYAKCLMAFLLLLVLDMIPVLTYNWQHGSVNLLSHKNTGR